MLTTAEIVALLIVGFVGHVMALVWYLAFLKRWGITKTQIYDLPFKEGQLRRELINSLHAPMHAVILGLFLWFGAFQASTIGSFIYSVAITFVWAEIWHYFSHRAMHMKPLHWIHVEHHRSYVNSPFTAISFSFWEKTLFDLGLLGLLALIDRAVSLNFYGIAAWYIGYIIVNSFSHANFEFKSSGYNRRVGQVLTSTTYHSLHHSRYTGNYGLATRVLDRVFGTEWPDYEPLFDRVTKDGRPLTKLRERIEAASPGRVSATGSSVANL
jgi:Delta7-sterol 5-desaturase